MNPELIAQLGKIVIPQLINLVAGMILHSQGSTVEAAAVLGRVGLPTDINITPEKFLEFIKSQQK